MNGTVMRFQMRHFISYNHDWIEKETNYAGYADYYLSEYDRPSDANARRLLDIDAIHGTDPALQLFRCINRTTRCDIIKV